MKQADVLRVLVEQLPRRGRRDSPVKHGRRWVLKFLFLFPVRHVAWEQSYNASVDSGLWAACDSRD